MIAAGNRATALASTARPLKPFGCWLCRHLLAKIIDFIFRYHGHHVVTFSQAFLDIAASNCFTIFIGHLIAWRSRRHGRGSTSAQKG